MASQSAFALELLWRGLRAMHHVPHGVACAIAMPGVIDVVISVMPDKVRRVGELMGLTPAKGLTPAELAAAVSQKIIAFNKELGIPTLRELKVKETDLLPMAPLPLTFTPVHHRNIIGTLQGNVRTNDDLPKPMDMIVKGEYTSAAKPVGKKFRLEEINDVHEAMANHELIGRGACEFD